MNDETTSKIVAINEEIVKTFELGSNLIDAFPFLAKIPFAKSLQRWRWSGDKLYRDALQLVPCVC